MTKRLRFFIFILLIRDLKLKGAIRKQKKTRNAMRCNNRDDLFHPNFTLKISIFSEAYV